MTFFLVLADGIPQASLFIRDEIEGVNGTFLPVAQPVIYGNRSYILMQFAPDSPVPDYKVIDYLLIQTLCSLT